MTDITEIGPIIYANIFRIEPQDSNCFHRFSICGEQLVIALSPVDIIGHLPIYAVTHVLFIFLVFCHTQTTLPNEQ